MDNKLSPEIHSILTKSVEQVQTPCYVYLLDDMLKHIDSFSSAFSSDFQVSYAIKSNPNPVLLEKMRPHVDLLDASSIGEVETALKAGYSAAQISFSGPAKRAFELKRATELTGLKIVCESMSEIHVINEIAKNKNQKIDILIRLNPIEVPRSFGITMAGAPSPFGIDEEALEQANEDFQKLENLNLLGFHAYSATNSLDIDAIDENFSIFIKLFEHASRVFNIEPQYLIFGAGFGIPYSLADEAINQKKLQIRILTRIKTLTSNPFLKNSQYVLESGRYLVGPYGYFLIQVVNRKSSRGTELCICDGGMNNHLAACGLMGMFLRRPWPMWNLSNHQGTLQKFTITGPLCTSIDTLGRNVEISTPEIGDTIAIGSSGAYGLTSSPVNFISHPHPKEYLIEQGKLIHC